MFPKNFFVKSHGLGNEYIVLIDKNISFALNKKNIETLCNVHYGIGSDGILVFSPSDKADAKISIYNPDGSEAEKSGNGLRIFCKFLYDYKIVHKKSMTIETIAGIVEGHITENSEGKAGLITVDIGKANFTSNEIPVKCDFAECMDYPLDIEGKTFLINCVSVGNPHCVIICNELNEAEVKKYGPLIENHAMFPNRINVQFAKIISNSKAEILIWERGAGYTLASGSSSSAVAAVLHKKGFCGPQNTISMPGGELSIEIKNNMELRLKGEARQIASGELSPELINSF